MEKKKKLKVIAGSLALLGFSTTAIYCDKKERTTSILGEYITTNNDKVYKTVEDAIRGIDALSQKYPEFPRRVTSAFYVLNGQTQRVNFYEDNYTFKEQDLLNKNATLVAVIAEVDLGNMKVLEGFYPKRSIRRSKEKTLHKTM